MTTDQEKIGAVVIERCGHNPRNGFLPWRIMPGDAHRIPSVSPDAG